MTACEDSPDLSMCALGAEPRHSRQTEQTRLTVSQDQLHEQPNLTVYTPSRPHRRTATPTPLGAERIDNNMASLALFCLFLSPSLTNTHTHRNPLHVILESLALSLSEVLNSRHLRSPTWIRFYDETVDICLHGKSETSQFRRFYYFTSDHNLKLEVVPRGRTWPPRGTQVSP